MSWGTVVPLHLRESVRFLRTRLHAMLHVVMYEKALIWVLTCWVCFDEPIQLWTVVMIYLSASVIAKLPTLWKVVGIVITFLFLNILVSIYLRVANVIIRLWKICKWICGLPLTSVVIAFFKSMYFFCVSIPGKLEKGEKKEKERQDKRANAVLGPNSRLFKKLGEHLAEAERKGVFNSQEEEKEQKVESDPCPRCERKRHENPCANSAMNPSEHGGTTLSSSERLSRRRGKLCLSRRSPPIMRLDRAKGKCPRFVSMTKLLCTLLFGSME